MSVYPPMKWEGIMVTFNRLLVDFAERLSAVRKDAS